MSNEQPVRWHWTAIDDDDADELLRATFPERNRWLRAFGLGYPSRRQLVDVAAWDAALVVVARRDDEACGVLSLFDVDPAASVAWVDAHFIAGTDEDESSEVLRSFLVNVFRNWSVDRVFCALPDAEASRWARAWPDYDDCGSIGDGCFLDGALRSLRYRVLRAGSTSGTGSPWP